MYVLSVDKIIVMLTKFPLVKKYEISYTDTDPYNGSNIIGNRCDVGKRKRCCMFNMILITTISYMWLI